MSSTTELVIALSKHIKNYPDFPKDGITFRDVMPIFSKPDLVKRLCKEIAHQVEGKVDVVTAIEARGFFFGPQVAIYLNLPFVPIRKHGKLPGNVISSEYSKEYGKDKIEVQTNAIKNGQRVLIIDDLLATGGTISAAVDLINKTNAIVTEIFFVVELLNLNGRAAIPENISINSILKF